LHLNPTHHSVCFDNQIFAFFDIVPVFEQFFSKHILDVNIRIYPELRHVPLTFFIHPPHSSLQPSFLSPIIIEVTST